VTLLVSFTSIRLAATVTVFQVGSSTHSGELVVSVVGELDLASTDEFLAEVNDAVGDEQNLKLDLSGVTFMDSTGLGALIKVRNRLVDRGGALSFVAVSAAVERVLTLTGMAETFGLEPEGQVDA